MARTACMFWYKLKRWSSWTQKDDNVQ